MALPPGAAPGHGCLLLGHGACGSLRWSTPAAAGATGTAVSVFEDPVAAGSSKKDHLDCKEYTPAEDCPYHEFQSTAASRKWRVSEIMDDLSYTSAYTACQAPHYEFATTVGGSRASADQEGFLCCWVDSIVRWNIETKALCSASQAGRFRVPDLHWAMFKNLPACGAPTLDFAASHYHRLATDAT